MIFGLKPTSLPADELKVCLGILATHNKVVDKHARKSKLSLRQYREEFHSGRIKPKLSGIDELTLSALDEEIKEKIISHHIRLVKNISLFFCRRFGITDACSKKDVLEEGIYGLVKALYGYVDTKISFTTYSHWAVTNTLKDYFRRNHSGLSPVSKEGVRLNLRIEKYRCQQVDYISFDQAVTDLRLDKNQIQDALEAQRMLYSVSPNYSSQSEEKEETYFPAEKVSVEDKNPDPDLVAAFYECPLNKVERAVMDAALNSWNGWMADLGRQFCGNKKKDIQRQYIYSVMKRAQKKIRSYYKGNIRKDYAQVA